MRFNFQWQCKGLLFLYNSSCLFFLHFYIFDDMPDVQNFSWQNFTPTNRLESIFNFWNFVLKKVSCFTLPGRLFEILQFSFSRAHQWLHQFRHRINYPVNSLTCFVSRKIEWMFVVIYRTVFFCENLWKCETYAIRKFVIFDCIPREITWHLGYLSRFGTLHHEFVHIITVKCHQETSFFFLL